MARSRCWFLVVLVSVGALAGGCGQPPADPWPAGKSPRILVSFPPLSCFATNVAGEQAAVLSLLMATGPHDYQPTSRDPLKLRRAELFFINGLELEHFADKLKNHSGNPNLPMIELGELIDAKDRLKMPKEDRPGHVHGEFDPHVWLGLPEAVRMVEGIRDELKKKDPAHAADYDKRAEAYNARLTKLHSYGKDKFKGIENRKLIAFHDSLRYFARAFDLSIVGVIQQKPGVEPEPAEIKKLIDLCKAEQVRVIAVEPQFPKAAAEQILKSITKAGVQGARIVEIDPLETAEPAEFGPEFYEQKMRKNIDTLAEALK